MNFIGRVGAAKMARLAVKCSFVAAAVCLGQGQTAQGAFEYGYFVHRYEDRCEYIEKDPPILKEGTVLGKVVDLPTQSPVLVEVHKGAVYLCKVLSTD